MPKCNNQVKKLRIQTQLSQNKLAHKAGLDSGTYRKAEHGKESVSEMTIERITAAFKSLLKIEIASASLIADD